MRTGIGAVMVSLTMLLAAPGSGGGSTRTPEPAESTTPSPADAADVGPPVLLVIQGSLAPQAEPVYEQYLEGTRPLMAEYGVAVERVGQGVGSELTTESWPVNAILRFSDLATAEAFLSDPRYLAIKERYRDLAYEVLHLSLFEPRASRVRTPKQVAEEAFEDFRAGLASGDWEPFLARLSDDFTLHFPLGRFQGFNRGKERAAEFFHFVSQAYPEGLEIEEVIAVTSEGNRTVFEFADRGSLRGQPYHNVVAVAFEVCGDQICAYREYFGLVGPPPSE